MAEPLDFDALGYDAAYQGTDGRWVLVQYKRLEQRSLGQTDVRYTSSGESPGCQGYVSPVIDGAQRVSSLTQGFLLSTSMLSVGIEVERLYREASLTNHLLDTAEAATGLPSAVVSLEPGVLSLRPGVGALPSEDEIAELVDRMREVAHLALATLGVLLCLTHYVAAWCVPPSAASPCGVIGLAAPIVPGAPPGSCAPTPRTYTLAA